MRGVLLKAEAFLCNIYGLVNGYELIVIRVKSREIRGLRDSKVSDNRPRKDGCAASTGWPGEDSDVT